MREVDIECTDRWGKTDGHGMGVCLSVDTAYDPHGLLAGRLQMDERGGSPEYSFTVSYLDEAALTALVVAAATALAEVQALK